MLFHDRHEDFENITCRKFVIKYFEYEERAYQWAHITEEKGKAFENDKDLFYEIGCRNPIHNRFSKKQKKKTQSESLVKSNYLRMQKGGRGLPKFYSFFTIYNYLRLVGFIPGFFTLPVGQTGLIFYNIKNIFYVHLRKNESIFQYNI